MIDLLDLNSMYTVSKVLCMADSIFFYLLELPLVKGNKNLFLKCFYFSCLFKSKTKIKTNSSFNYSGNCKKTKIKNTKASKKTVNICLYINSLS